MTALHEYQRLECTGLWRDAPESQRRDVLVSFGDASLIIRELPSERALSHWSLPAVVRRNPGRMPAIFAPGPDMVEELEIDDESMIAAIAKVHAIIARRRPHPGRLRGAFLAGVAAAIGAAALFWLPGALIRHTASVLPASTRADLGQAILQDVIRLTGQPCNAPEGREALARLGQKLLGPDGRLVVLPEGLATALHLPGKIVAIGRPLVEGEEGPEVAAGYVLAERTRAETTDPVPDALRFGGLSASIHLLTSGNVPGAAFHGYGERLLKATPQPVDPEALLARFRAAGVSAAPYAYALDKTGETTLPLIEADPFASTPPPGPLIDDNDWVALQGLCGG